MSRRTERQPKKKKNNREGYTFSHQQKQEKLEEDFYVCERCGKHETKDNRLEANHFLSIWFAREAGIPQALIKSTKNLEILCHSCHTKSHLQESRYQYSYIAWILFGLDLEVDESKDDWRKDPNHPINRKR